MIEGSLVETYRKTFRGRDRSPTRKPATTEEKQQPSLRRLSDIIATESKADALMEKLLSSTFRPSAPASKQLPEAAPEAPADLLSFANLAPKTLRTSNRIVDRSELQKIVQLRRLPEEIKTTEESYVLGLETAFQVLHCSNPRNELKLTVEEASNINLMNILTNSLHREHSDVLRQLEKALAETTEFPAIGKAFQFGKPSAKFHQSFGKCYQIWTSTVENNRGKGLDAWLEQHKVQDMDLSSWFIRVVQRPPRYLLFADQILDATKYRGALSDVEEWEKARVCIKRLAESLNEGADEQINHDGLKKWIPILHQEEDGEEFLNIGKRADILGPTTRFIGEISQMRLDYDGQVDNYRVVVFNTCILFGTVRDTRFTPAFFFDTWSCLPREDRLLSLQGTVRFADDELATHKTLCHLVDKAVARLLPADEKQRSNLQTKVKDGEEIVTTLQLNLGVTQVPELVEGDYTKGGVELANQMLNDPEYLRQLEAFRAKNQPSTPRRIGRALKRAFTPSSQKLDRLRDAAVPGIQNLSPKESRLARLRSRRRVASPSPPPMRRRASIGVVGRDTSPVRTPPSKTRTRKPASAVPTRIRADRTPFQSPPASPSKPKPTPKPKFSRKPSEARETTHVSTPSKKPVRARSEAQLSNKSEERIPKSKQTHTHATPAPTPKARKQTGPSAKSPLSDRSNQKPTPQKISKKKHSKSASNPSTPSMERNRT